MNPATYRKDYTPSPNRMHLGDTKFNVEKILVNIQHHIIDIHNKTIVLIATEKDLTFDIFNTLSS